MGDELEKLKQDIKDNFPNDKIEFVNMWNGAEAIKVNDKFIKEFFSNELIKEIERFNKVDLDEEIKRLIIEKINNFLQS